MNASSFRPVDVLRRIEDDLGAKAEAVGATFEAFSSLGSDKGRKGDAEALIRILHQIVGPSPFGSAESSLRLKVSAKTGKPVVIEIVSAAAPLTVGAETEALVAAMQGTVSRTAGAAGATVRVTLPLEEAEPDAEEPEAQPQEENASLVGTRILIADDSATNRLVLEEMLADTGAGLVSVHDGKEALEAWRGAQFDLLLLDISMPVMDGVTAIREIRAAEKDRGVPATPAIAVTANALVNQVADYLVAGFDTHLAKPFRRKDLMHAILTLRR